MGHQVPSCRPSSSLRLVPVGEAGRDFLCLAPPNAAGAIDKHGGPTATAEELETRRARQLLKGPSSFREVRKDRLK